jgi:Uma2 family endonuclease
MTHTLSVQPDSLPGPGPHTWADFIALDEDDLRELIDGELLELEVPTRAHERIAVLLAHFLEGWAETHGGETSAPATRSASPTSAV